MDKMTDKELLEAALRAAGDDPADYPRDVANWRWNSLTDKGDAVSLLLKLKMRVEYVDDQPCIDGVVQHGMTAEESFCRAVTRAAAARRGGLGFGAA